MYFLSYLDRVVSHGVMSERQTKNVEANVFANFSQPPFHITQSLDTPGTDVMRRLLP